MQHCSYERVWTHANPCLGTVRNGSPQIDPSIYLGKSAEQGRKH